MLSCIPSEIHIKFLVQTWEPKQFKVPNIDGFILWLVSNKKSSHRGFGGITLS